MPKPKTKRPESRRRKNLAPEYLQLDDAENDPSEKVIRVVTAVTKEDIKAKKEGSFFKVHYCTFCSKPQQHIARHLQEMHYDEKEVEELVKFPKKSKEKNKRLEYLKNRGAYEHNMKVIASGFGDFIVRRRPTDDDVSYELYKPCPHCWAFLTKKELTTHGNKGCSFRGLDKVKKKKLHQESDSLLLRNKGLSAEMASLITNLKDDEVTAIVKKDETMMLLGQMMFDKFNDTKRHEYHIRERLRELGKLLIKLREGKGEPERDLKSFVNPTEWDFFCETVKSMCKSDGKARNTLALKLGHSIMKVCTILWGQAMRKKDEDGKKNAKDFQKLYEREWSSKVSSRVLKDMKDQKLNTKQEQPLDGDIKRLSNGLQAEVEEWTEKFKQLPCWSTGKKLIDAMLAFVILFNRKRSGEVGKMVMKNYTDAKECSKNIECDEAFKSLSEFEQRIAKEHLLVKLIGKKDRHVPLLIPSFMVESMDMLVNPGNREKMGIPASNQFLFPVRKEDRHVEPCSILRSFATNPKFALQRPDLIKTTGLRKQLATAVQVLNLPENQLDWLAGFMVIQICNYLGNIMYFTTHLLLGS